MRRLKRFFGLPAALLLMHAGTVFAEPRRLTLDEALELAGENNYALKAAKARVDQAEARYVQSRKAYLPTVTVSETFVATDDPAAVFSYKLRQGGITSGDFNPAVMNDPDDISNFRAGIEVTQPIYNRDAQKGRSAAASAKTSSRHMLERAGDTVSLEVKKAYYGLILARKNREALNRSIRSMRAHDREAADAYEKGLVTKSDKLSTAVRLSELAERKMMIEDEIDAAGDALRFLLGLRSDVEILPVGGLDVGRVAIPPGEPGLGADRSDLKALEARAEAAGYEYDMAKAGRLPRLNAFLQQSWNDSDFPGLDNGNWAVGVSMQWTIFDGYADIGRAQEARAKEMEVRYNYEEAREKGVFDIRKAYRMLKTAKSRIMVAEEALKEAKVSLDFIGDRYRSGLAMTFELLARERAYTQAQLRLNRARYDLIMARNELDFYSGK